MNTKGKSASAQNENDVAGWIEQPLEAYEQQSYGDIAQKVEEHFKVTDMGKLEVGILLRDTFFGNDEKRFRSRSPKENSVRRLAQALAHRGRAMLPRSTLHEMIAVGFDDERLGISVKQKAKLSYTHRVRLLRVKDPALKLKLALEVVKKGWSTDALADRIKEAIGTKKRDLVKGVLNDLKRVRESLDTLEDSDAVASDDLVLIVEGLKGLAEKAAELYCTLYPEQDSQDVSERSDTEASDSPAAEEEVAHA